MVTLEKAAERDHPQLVFFSELPRKELTRMQLWYPRLFEQLAAIGAEVSVGLMDMSPERAMLFVRPYACRATGFAADLGPTQHPQAQRAPHSGAAM